MILEELAAARKELKAKTKTQIEAETAAKWGARAVAAYEMFKATNDLSWYGAAIEYQHEAVEHAASGPPGTLDQIELELHQAITNVFSGR